MGVEAEQKEVDRGEQSLWGWLEAWGTLRIPTLPCGVPAPAGHSRHQAAGLTGQQGHRQGWPWAPWSPPSSRSGSSPLAPGLQGKATHQDTGPLPTPAVEGSLCSPGTAANL